MPERSQRGGPLTPGGPPSGTSGKLRAGRWLLAIVGLALLVRLPLLALPGHGYDLGFFTRWTDAIEEGGLSRALDASPPVDYPAFPYLLWPIAEVYGPHMEGDAAADETLQRLVKLPGIAGDLLVVVVLFFLTRSFLRRYPGLGWPFGSGAKNGNTEKLALLAAALWAFNPAVIYDSAYWGQIDSWIALAMLGGLAATMANRPALAGMSVAAGFALKPQTAMIAPVLGLAAIRESGLKGAVWWIAGAVGGLALVLGYFIASGSGGDIVETYSRITSYRLHVSYNAWNIWTPVELNGNPTPADSAVHIAGFSLSFQTLGLMALVVPAILLLLWQAPRPGPREVAIGAIFSIFSFFMLATAVHERYLVYALALLAPLAVLERKWAVMYGLLSFSVLLNISASLPPTKAWGDVVNGVPFSLAMASFNGVVYCVFAGLMFALKTNEPEMVTDTAPARVTPLQSQA